ncbi:MAG: hypothetical protein JWL66_2210 [Sphingomonadales bacterium]|nr:hypothetical protein [Sphingomonadales bacterium]
MIRSRHILKAAAGLLLGTGAVPLSAQTVDSIQYPAGYAPGTALCVRQADGSCSTVSTMVPMPVTTKQESLTLVAANTPSVATAVSGGNYVVSQMCTSYNAGSLAVRYRGPDGATMLPMLTKTASDTTGGMLIALSGNAVVDAVLPLGSVGCNVTLARVP